jgi:hypothetical protein
LAGFTLVEITANIWFARKNPGVACLPLLWVKIEEIQYLYGFCHLHYTHMP